MRLEFLELVGNEPLTVEEAKEYLHIDGNEEDALIASLISAARSYCEEYTKQIFCKQKVRLTVPAQDVTKMIELPRSKYLDSIESVVEFAPDNGEKPLLFEGYSCGYVNQQLVLKDTADVVGDVRIIYITGCDEISDKVKTAIRLLVAGWYENRLPYGDKAMNEQPYGIMALLNGERVLM